LSIVRTGRFKKDYKLAKKQNRDLNKLRDIVELLDKRKPLPPKYRDHKLSGYPEEHRGCHVESDWLLIYRFDGDDLILERIGSHSDLFG